jgi:hypothetical protein
LAGEYGSGKSQICQTLCVASNLLIENSHYNDSKNGSIIFIDSNTFRADGLDPFPILEKIYHCKIYSSEHLESIEQYNAKLILYTSMYYTSMIKGHILLFHIHSNALQRKREGSPGRPPDTGLSADELEAMLNSEL